QLAELEASAGDALRRYQVQRERAVAVVRFSDAFLFDFTTYLLAGSGDLVDLLSQVRVLERLLSRQAAELDELQRLHEESLQAQAQLLTQRQALNARERVLRLFQEARRQREELLASHPNPLFAQLAWLADMPLAL